MRTANGARLGVRMGLRDVTVAQGLGTTRGGPAPEPRALHLPPGGAEEGRLASDLRARTLHLSVGVFLLTAAVTLAKTGRDALYFLRGGLRDLPNAYLGMALLSVPLGFLTILLMRRLGPRRARLLVLSAMAGFLLLYSQVAGPGGGLVMTVLYMHVPLTIGIAFSVYWLLAADLLEGAPAGEIGRVYSFIGASSIAGGLFGGLAARILSTVWEPRTLILLGALAVASSLAVVARAQRRFPPPLPARVEAAGGLGFGDLWCVLRQRYVLLLLLTGMAAALVGLLVEFRFYVAAATSGNGPRQNASLFATVYLVLNAAALALQLFVTPRLQRAIGVHGSLLVLPSAVLGGAATLLASASVLAPLLLRIADGGLRSAIHRVSWEQAYLSIEKAQRAQAKLVVDGMAGRLAEGGIALALLAWLHFVVGERPLVGQDGAPISYLLVAATLAWVGLARALRIQAGARSAWRETHGMLHADLPLPDT